MRFPPHSTILLFACLLLPACKGNQGESPEATTQPLNKAHLTECKCGTPDADIFGCTAPCCLGEACDNPKCTCEQSAPAESTTTKPAVQKMDGTGYTGPGSAETKGTALAHTITVQVTYQSYVTKDDKVIKGRPIKREGERIRFQMPIAGGGSVESLKPLTDFSPHSGYNILRRLEPGHDLMSHIALAKFALENGLISTTKREIKKARTYAKDDAELAEFDRKVKAGAARILKQLFHKALAEDNLKDAYRFGSLLMTRLPDQMTEAEKEEMLTAYENAKAAKDKAAHDQKVAKADAKRSKEEARLIKPIEDRLTKADKAGHKGLVGGSNQSTALKHFKQAIKDYGWAMKRIDKEKKKSANSSDVYKSEMMALERRAVSGYTDANLNAGSIYLGRSSLNNARKNVNNILAIDPKNSRALSMRARIEIAGNQGWGYGGLGGGRRVAR